MKASRPRFLGGDGHAYRLLRGGQNPLSEDSILWRRKHSILGIILVLFAGLVAVFIVGASGGDCDTVEEGFRCYTRISRYWGQYSPYFNVPSEISSEVPPGCHITFAQVLSRHGARDPTASKTEAYNATIQKIHDHVKEYRGRYAFLQEYKYTLGADQLTTFGERELVNSGVQFYNRYHELASTHIPFIRSSGEDRVVVSAQNWTQGFTSAKKSDDHANTKYPEVDLIIPEADGINNTLHHALCTAFETGPFSNISDDAKTTWASVFAAPIQERLNHDLPNANLTLQETIYLMDLCPFSIVATPTVSPSPFCNLFTTDEWRQYNYLGALDKYYGYLHGNPLGPTQGVGFVNELIARLTDRPVVDNTSTNHTLDRAEATFPLGRRLYADFSHDNDITAILAAMGLYNSTHHLPTDRLVEGHGYSAATTVPFAARVYVEKMVCPARGEGEWVRVVVNGRVQPLEMCGGDGRGMCRLGEFVDSLGFARGDGEWERCFDTNT